jgi:putative PIN family toxin of toxin-antitoxin system
VNVVLDTNIYIGAVITPRGPAGQVVTAWRGSAFDVVLSRQLIAEIERALTYPQVQRYMSLGSIELADLMDRLYRIAIRVDPETALSISRDPDDNPVLEAAVAGEAEYVVTNDNDLLSLGTYADIEIVTAAHFLRILKALSGA